MEAAALLLGWLLVEFVEAMYYTRGHIPIPNLQCTQYLFCSERDRGRWLEKRRIYKELVALRKRPFVNMYYFNDSPTSVLALGHWYNYFCKDHQSAPFLMVENDDNWQIACLWSGNDANGSCAPIRPINKPIMYIEPHKWQCMLNKFRRSINCPEKAISAVKKAQELYICTERCVHGGIGYMPVMLISATLMVSITLLCFRG